MQYKMAVGLDYILQTSTEQAHLGQYSPGKYPTFHNVMVPSATLKLQILAANKLKIQGLVGTNFANYKVFVCKISSLQKFRWYISAIFHYSLY